MALVVRIFDGPDGPSVLVTTKKRPRNICKEKVVRGSDGKPICGVLEAMVAHEDLVGDLDLLAQTAFDLGRAYKDKK